MTVEEWIAAYGEAWRSKDETAVVKLFTEQGLYLSSPTQSPHAGRDAIAACWRRATAHPVGP